MLKIEKNMNLKFVTTLKTNAVAQFYTEVKTRNEIIEAVKYCQENKIRLILIGGGSNIAFLKEKIKGLVVKNRYQEFKVMNNTPQSLEIKVSSGYLTNQFVNKVIELGGEGVEYHLGLPGTIGGAIYMNAKWTKPITFFGDYLIKAYLLTPNLSIKTVGKDYFQFAYDYSSLQNTKEILLEAIFKFKKDKPEDLKKRANEAFFYRKKTQPQGVFTAGCFFQNLNNVSAGYLIDKAGLKGKKIGDFIISPLHANFIINLGQGKAKDLKALIQLIKKTVKKKFGLSLKEEVIVYE